MFHIVYSNLEVNHILADNCSNSRTTFLSFEQNENQRKQFVKNDHSFFEPSQNAQIQVRPFIFSRLKIKNRKNCFKALLDYKVRKRTKNKQIRTVRRNYNRKLMEKVFWNMKKCLLKQTVDTK